MSSTEHAALRSTLDTTLKMLSWLKALVCVSFGAGVWATAVTIQLAGLRADINTAKVATDARVENWTAWRSKKDLADAALTTNIQHNETAISALGVRVFAIEARNMPK